MLSRTSLVKSEKDSDPYYIKEEDNLFSDIVEKSGTSCGFKGWLDIGLCLLLIGFGIRYHVHQDGRSSNPHILSSFFTVGKGEIPL